MSCAAAFKLEQADASVEYKKVQDGDFRFHGLGKFFDTVIAVHVHLHHLYNGARVMGFDGAIGEEFFPASFAFARVAYRQNDSGGVERKELTSALQAHTGAATGDYDGLALEVDACGEGVNFGLHNDAHGAEKVRHFGGVVKKLLRQ